MSRRHHSPRHLDDPLRPLFGLSLAQIAGAVLAVLGGFGTWKLCGLVPGTSFVFTEIRIFLSGSIAGLLFFATYLLAGDRSEPYARQLWHFLQRPQHYHPTHLAPEPPPPETTPVHVTPLCFPTAEQSEQSSAALPTAKGRTRRHRCRE